ncbi:MAG: hypothetical protein KGL39_22495 [Patescibacteria group bacterium]|nr:hypothetical protein [Patescibacteria group bacterium]
MAARLTILVLALSLAARTASADITVIQPPDAFRILGAYRDAGYSLSTPDGFWLSTPTNGGGSVWYPGQNPYYLGQDAFDAAAIHNPDPMVTLTYSVGGETRFNVISIALAPEYDWEPVLPSVTFVGTHPDGSQTSDTVTLTADSFQAFALPGMTDITAMTWEQGPWDTQFTDVNVQALPEPSTFTTTIVIAAGATVPLAVRRRRNRPVR